MSVSHRVTRSLRTANATITDDVTYEGSSAPTVDKNIAAGSYRVDAPIGSYTAANLISVFIVSAQAATLRVGGTDEVQTISMTGSVTGGTFPLTFNGQTASALPYNATSTQVQTALNALSSIGGATHGSVICGGGPLPGTPITVQFSGDLAQTDVAPMTTSGASLTGGGTVAVATTTAGVAPSQTIALAGGVPLSWVKDDPVACPLTVNAGRWTISVAGTSSSQLRAYLLSL